MANDNGEWMITVHPEKTNLLLITPISIWRKFTGKQELVKSQGHKSFIENVVVGIVFNVFVNLLMDTPGDLSNHYLVVDKFRLQMKLLELSLDMS